MGGSSSSKETVNKTVNRITTTTTVGDIGFTGQNAVDVIDTFSNQFIQAEKLFNSRNRGLIKLTENAFENITQQMSETNRTQQRQSELAAQTVGALAARATGDDPDDDSDPRRLERLAVVFGGVAVLLTLIQKG